MTFPELFLEIQKLKRDEQRLRTADYLEVVIAKDHFKPLNEILTAYFGPPLKPEGQAPSGEAIRQAAPHGGIRKDQTMYFREGDDLSQYALVWPWGSGNRVTVKIIQAKRSDLKGGWQGFLTGLFSRGN